MNSMPERGKYLRGLRAWSGFRQIGLSFRRDERAQQVTAQYTLKTISAPRTSRGRVIFYDTAAYCVYCWAGGCQDSHCSA